MLQPRIEWTAAEMGASVAIRLRSNALSTCSVGFCFCRASSAAGPGSSHQPSAGAAAATSTPPSAAAAGGRSKPGDELAESVSVDAAIPVPRVMSWEDMERLHANGGMGYLQAVMQLQQGTATGDSGLLRAAEWLCSAAATRRADAAAALAVCRVLEAALSEATAALGMTSDVVLILCLEAAATSKRAGQHEAALRRLKWLMRPDRASRLPAEWSDGFWIKFSAAKCLQQLNRHTEAVGFAHEAYETGRKSHGDACDATIEALLTCLDSDNIAKCLPPATRVAMLEHVISDLERVCDDAPLPVAPINAHAMYMYSSHLFTCYFKLNDTDAMVRVSSHLVQWIKSRLGKQHENYQLVSTHGESTQSDGRTSFNTQVPLLSPSHSMSTHTLVHAVPSIADHSCVCAHMRCPA